MSVSLIDGHIDDDVLEITVEGLIEELVKVRYHLTSQEHKFIIDDVCAFMKRQETKIERLKRTIAGLSLYYKDLANFEKIYTDETARYAFEKAAKHTEEMAGEG